MDKKIKALMYTIKDYYNIDISFDNAEKLLIDKDYLVLTSEESDKYCIEYLESLFNEDISYFNVNIEYYLNEDFFKSYYKESYENYIEDIKYEDGRLEQELKESNCNTEEEYLQYLLSNVKNYAEEYIFEFGKNELNNLIKYYPECIDKNKLFDDIILNDGRGNILSGYDGIEHEVEIEGELYYVYRNN